MTTTTETTTTRTCPPSAVVDMIVRWQDVQAGDLVVLEDALIVAERVQVYQSPWGDGTTFPQVNVYHRLDNGRLVSSERHGDRYTAVRRYTEGSSEREALVIAALDEAAADRDERARGSDCLSCGLAPGKCPEHREDAKRAAEYRAERDRLEAGR